ncbi:MAG: hypothetical protein ACRD4E_07740, partial [Bryobacteraceae bacterium]
IRYLAHETPREFGNPAQTHVVFARIVTFGLSSLGAGGFSGSATQCPTSQSSANQAAGPEPLPVESSRRIQSMAKPNYQQVRKQKERARKARQEEKQQRRAARVDGPGDTTDAASAAESPAPAEPASGPTT